MYTVATKAYLALGNDGYVSFADSSVEKQSCQTPEDLEKLPLLRNEIIKFLEDWNSKGLKLDVKLGGETGH